MMTIVFCLTSAINSINASITVRGLINSLGDLGCQNNFAMSYMLQKMRIMLGFRLMTLIHIA